MSWNGYILQRYSYTGMLATNLESLNITLSEGHDAACESSECHKQKFTISAYVNTFYSIIGESSEETCLSSTYFDYAISNPQTFTVMASVGTTNLNLSGTIVYTPFRAY